jgi:hypothetical protein
MLPRALLPLVFEACGEFQVMRVCRHWHDSLPSGWLCFRRFPFFQSVVPILHASLSASMLFHAGVAARLSNCVWLEVLHDEILYDGQRILDLCAQLPRLRHLRLRACHVNFRQEQGSTSLRSLELANCTSNANSASAPVPTLMIREHRSVLPAQFIPSEAQVVLIDRNVVTVPRNPALWLWVLPRSLVPGHALEPPRRNANIVTVLECADEVLRLRMQSWKLETRSWTFLTASLPLASRVELPHGAVVCFGYGLPQRTVAFEPETCSVQDDVVDICGLDGKTLVACHRTQAVAFHFEVDEEADEPGRACTGKWLKRWVPTPEPLCKIAFCASARAYFGLGARDPRQVWKFGLAGDLQCSLHLAGLPCNTACLLLVTRSYVHVCAVSGQWQNLAFDLTVVDSGPVDPWPTLAIFECEHEQKEGPGWSPVSPLVVPLGMTRETWPLNLLPVPAVKAEHALTVPATGVLVMASRKQVVRAECRGTLYQPLGEPVLLQGQEVRALAALGPSVWQLDAAGRISKLFD